MTTYMKDGIAVIKSGVDSNFPFLVKAVEMDDPLQSFYGHFNGKKSPLCDSLIWRKIMDGLWELADHVSYGMMYDSVTCLGVDPECVIESYGQAFVSLPLVVSGNDLTKKLVQSVIAVIYLAILRGYDEGEEQTVTVFQRDTTGAIPITHLHKVMSTLYDVYSSHHVCSTGLNPTFVVDGVEDYVGRS